jgi:hypothetical protein
MLYYFDDVVSMFPITSKVLWQHFIFNVFAFIPILNDKKYYIKMYLLGLLLAFPLFNNFDIYTKGILVLIMNYLKQLILMLFKLCIFTRQ